MHRCSLHQRYNYKSYYSHSEMSDNLVTMRAIFVFLLVLPALQGQLPRQYTQHRLELLCRADRKVSINLGKKPAEFLFSGSSDSDLECHLELRSPSSQFGLYVFIDELKLNNTPNCESDFLQFGR